MNDMNKNPLDHMGLEELNARMAKLPEMAAIEHPTTGEPVIVKRGVTGYWPMIEGKSLAEFNETFGAEDAAVLKAMEGGSLFGFHLPIADPDTYR